MPLDGRQAEILLACLSYTPINVKYQCTLMHQTRSCSLIRGAEKTFICEGRLQATIRAHAIPAEVGWVNECHRTTFRSVWRRMSECSAGIRTLIFFRAKYCSLQRSGEICFGGGFAEQGWPFELYAVGKSAALERGFCESKWFSSKTACSFFLVEMQMQKILTTINLSRRYLMMLQFSAWNILGRIIITCNFPYINLVKLLIMSKLVFRTYAMIFQAYFP